MNTHRKISLSSHRNDPTWHSRLKSLKTGKIASNETQNMTFSTKTLKNRDAYLNPKTWHFLLKPLQIGKLLKKWVSILSSRDPLHFKFQKVKRCNGDVNVTKLNSKTKFPVTFTFCLLRGKGWGFFVPFHSRVSMGSSLRPGGHFL